MGGTVREGADPVEEERTVGHVWQKERRLGKFEISRKMLETGSWDLITTKIFGQMVILRAELMAHKDTIEYTAVCKAFDPAVLLQELPQYTFEITAKGDEIVSVTPKRMT